MGGVASGARSSKIVRIRARRAGAPSLAGASRRQPQLAISVVDRVDAASVARAPLADDITVISLLPAEAHVERLRAAGVAVIDLDFKSPHGLVSGLFRMAKLIAVGRPDIVQGWMYHGDLAALVALALSGRFRRTCLIWSI